MLPAESKLEVRTCLPARANGNARKPPLLFVHGGYCDAWCWAPHFLPWFAERGYAAHALSLRGHGASGGHETMFVTGLDDYAADVERVAATLPSPPVLIGHSMGAAIVERLLATGPVRAAALLSPVPPTGLLPMAARLAAEQPEYLLQLSQFDPARLTAHVLDVLRPYYFSADVAPEILLEATRHLGPESPRALLDLSLRLHWQLPDRNGFRCSCWGRRTTASRRGRRPRDRGPPRRRGDDRARSRAHADAGAASGRSRHASSRAG